MDYQGLIQFLEQENEELEQVLDLFETLEKILDSFERLFLVLSAIADCSKQIDELGAFIVANGFPAPASVDDFPFGSLPMTPECLASYEAKYNGLLQQYGKFLSREQDIRAQLYALLQQYGKFLSREQDIRAQLYVLAPDYVRISAVKAEMSDLTAVYDSISAVKAKISANDAAIEDFIALIESEQEARAAYKAMVESKDSMCS